jgi:oxamate amidohydrolase
MLHSLTSRRGIVVAPHHLAATAGLAVLRDGGNAVEAMVAAAATIAVTYPHMNSIGGDGFWLIAEPGRSPIGIDACGAAATAATREFYSGQGFREIPPRGPLAALTVAGTVSGWEKALGNAARWGGKRLPLQRLLADSITYAKEGVPVTEGFSELLSEKRSELEGVPGFKGLFLADGVPKGGTVLKNPALAAMLAQLASAGLGDFYRGEVGHSMAADLAACGSPLTLSDLASQHADTVAPLSVRLSAGRAYNLPPPTQGLASLLILALYARMPAPCANGFDHIHRLVECTKAAFRVRETAAVDPRYAQAPVQGYLTSEAISALAEGVNLTSAQPWPQAQAGGDTVWMGAIDGEGRAVSFIQSTYWEFGSGLVLPQTGVVWQNRGASFSLDPASPNALLPWKKPFHTLNPALARFKDGRILVYGTMGGDGQPQTQAAIFTRYACHGMGLQAAVSAPRWLLGRTWGESSTTLKLEARFPHDVMDALRSAGHATELVPEFSPLMGHAGAIVRYPNGVLEGASDPRSDGVAAAF